MISLVCDGEVIAAFVGDVMTQEIYGYRPDSDKVHRIMEYETHECLEIDPSRPLSDQYILLRDAPGLCSDPVQTLLGTGCFFRGLEVTGGSIGITMARLWKSEVGAVVLRPGDETPWDLCPILGISEKLGFRFMAYNENSRQFENRPPLVTPEKQQRDYEVIVVHESRVAELNGWPEIIR
ncbi:MAG: hypothetical protein BWY68_00572 [bacterium ADurb.Bin400]|nr:MAG: hypothetical protein BWY68_00572 [bacterium ADurb.Bin400]